MCGHAGPSVLAQRVLDPAPDDHDLGVGLPRVDRVVHVATLRLEPAHGVAGGVPADHPEARRQVGPEGDPGAALREQLRDPT